MKYYLFSLGVSLIYGGLAYLVFDNLFYALGTLVVFLIFTMAFLAPLANRYKIKVSHHHEAYRFINNFIVSLSVTSSPEVAYNSAVESIDDLQFQDMTKRIETMGVYERIEYLDNFFEVTFYGMFLSIYRIYVDQGGDCLTVADPLLKEITRDEEYTRTLDKNSKRLLLQFALFWFLSGFILGFLRFGLSGYYKLMLQFLAFRLIGIAYLILVLVSFFIFAKAYTGLPLFRRKHHG